MPLPVASTAYMPNPLTGIRASQAGLAQGQQTIQGGIQAAQGTANVLSTIQDIQQAPEKLKIQQRAADRADAQFEFSKVQHADNFGLQQTQEARMQKGQDFTQGPEFDLEKAKFDLDKQKKTFDMQMDRAKFGIERGKQAEKEVVGRVATDYTVNGNLGGVAGFVGDLSTAQGQKNFDRLVTGLSDRPEIIADMGRRAAEEKLITADPGKVALLDAIERAASFTNKYKPVADDSDAAMQQLAALHGVHPTPGKKLALIQNGDNWAFGQKAENGEMTSGGEKFHSIGGFFGTIDPKKLEDTSVLVNRINSGVRIKDIETENVTKNIEAAAKQKAATTAATDPDNEERLTKDKPAGRSTNVTPNFRMGFGNAPADEQGENKLTQQMNQATAQLNKNRGTPARNRFAGRVGAQPVAEPQKPIRNSGAVAEITSDWK